MLTHGPILVPLDGSELAECALPYAGILAEKLHTHLVLATIWEGADADLSAAFPAMELELTKGAQTHFEDYLHDLRDRLPATTKTVVRFGDAPQEIIKLADESGARLIALATHGRSGLGRWISGSTADQLLRDAPVPVLAIGPHALENKRAATGFQKVLVPLDGTPLSESALSTASQLAMALGATLCLGRAVRWATQAYPYTLPETYTPEVDAQMEKSAAIYLRHKQSDIKDVENVESFVVRGATASGLLELVEQQGIDLVVMTTHARGGIARTALGSVADRMLQGQAPVLLLRPDEA